MLLQCFNSMYTHILSLWTYWCNQKKQLKQFYVHHCKIVATHSMAIRIKESERERKYSLLVKIVILISYTQIIIPHAYFAFSTFSSFRFICFIFGFIYSSTHWKCIWRIYAHTHTNKQTINIHRLNRSPFLRANLWFCCSGRFLSFSHSSLLIITQESGVYLCFSFLHFGVNSKYTSFHTQSHTYYITIKYVCMYKV